MQYPITIQGNAILLNTYLTEEKFGKSFLTPLLYEDSYIASYSKKYDYDTFTKTTFDGTLTVDDCVYFTMHNFTGSVLGAMNASNKEEGEEPRTESKETSDIYSMALTLKVKRALFSVSSCYINALKKGLSLPSTSPFGIVINEESGKILFINETAFLKCASNMGVETYNLLLEPWRDSALGEKGRILFTLGVYIYFMLVKALPYPNASNLNKDVSIAYKNFLPLEYAVNGVSSLIATFTNKCLMGVKEEDAPSVIAMLGSSFLDTLYKEAFYQELLEGKQELLEGKSEEKCNELESLKEEGEGENKKKPYVRNKLYTEKEFTRRAVRYKKRQNRRIKRRKLTNRYLATVIGTGAIVLFIALFTLYAVLDKGKKPSVIGLTSREVVTVFYTGLHQMNTDYMEVAAKNCIEAGRYISQVPQIYITGQLRSMFSMEAGVVTPEAYMFFSPDSSRAYNHTIYGITNYTIDDIPSILLNPPPKRRDHKGRIVKEGEEILNDFSTRTHRVHYYLVHTVDDKIQVDEYNTTAITKYVVNKWQLFSLHETHKTTSISPLTLNKEMKKWVKIYSGDAIRAVEKLKVKYPFLPSREALVKEKEKLDRQGY